MSNTPQLPPQMKVTPRINIHELLARISEGQRFQVIADQMSIGLGSVSRLAKELSEAGYLSRLTGPRGQGKYELTSAGKALLASPTSPEPPPKKKPTKPPTDYSIKPITNAEREAPMSQAEMDALTLTAPSGFRIRVIKPSHNSPHLKKYPVYLDFAGITLARFHTHPHALMAATLLAPAIRSHNSIRFKSALIGALDLYEGVAGVQI